MVVPGQMKARQPDLNSSSDGAFAGAIEHGASRGEKQMGDFIAIGCGESVPLMDVMTEHQRTQCFGLRLWRQRRLLPSLLEYGQSGWQALRQT